MSTITINYLSKTNQPPNSSGWLNLFLNNGELHTFTLENFTTETTPPYDDPEGDSLEAIKITSLPTEGSLTLDGSPIVVNQIVTTAELIAGDLKYQSDASITEGYLDGDMTFLVSDNGSSIFTLKPQIVSFIIEDSLNEPPSQVGDGQVDVEAGGTFVFTRDSLTSQLNPPYLDPEGNPAENLRIISLPTEGVLKWNGNEVFDDTVVPFTDIDAGLLIYISDSLTNEGLLEGFEFEISDTGSGEYR